MPETDFHQPGPGPLCAAAEAAELAQAASGLASAYGNRLADRDPLVPLARGIARSMTEAGLAVHGCAPADPGYRLGRVCLRPLPAETAVRRGGIAAPWTTHSLLSLDWDRCGTCTGTWQSMNTAIGGILRAFGYPVEPFGAGGAWLVTGHRDQDPGAGR